MLKQSVNRIVPRKLKKKLVRAFWPYTRWRKDPCIFIRTYYPDCTVKLTHDGQTWSAAVTNGDPSKISTEEIQAFFLDPLQSRFPNIRLKRGFGFDLLKDSVSLESWRDIHQGRIQELIDDEGNEFESNQIGSFGFLLGITKPERLRFIEYTKEHPERFAYIETEKYSKTMKGFLSLLDYKRKFKYIIDLPGHTYSTKSYWMLFLRRPLFYVEPNQKFSWEKQLKPWRHYIPVQRDYSDLVQRYEWAESHPDEVRKLSENLFDFGIRQLPPSRVHTQFLDLVQKCVEPLPSHGETVR